MYSSNKIEIRSREENLCMGILFRDCRILAEVMRGVVCRMEGAPIFFGVVRRQAGNAWRWSQRKTVRKPCRSPRSSRAFLAGAIPCGCTPVPTSTRTLSGKRHFKPGCSAPSAYVLHPRLVGSRLVGRTDRSRSIRKWRIFPFRRRMRASGRSRSVPRVRSWVKVDVLARMYRGFPRLCWQKSR
jgi:hypothetical protein